MATRIELPESEAFVTARVMSGWLRSAGIPHKIEGPYFDRRIYFETMNDAKYGIEIIRRHRHISERNSRLCGR